MPTAEIITIGTELLLGETIDTNTRFIARALRGLGVDLYRTLTVGDNAERIAEAVRDALGRAEIVITTGGLGPTVDDPTRQAITQAAGVELEFHPELWEQITARITRYGRTPTENQKRQAYIPKGALVIENPVGTAPAFVVEISPSPLRLRSGQAPTPLPLAGEGKKVVISLPGVPREMETLLTDAVIPYLQKRFDLHEVIKVRTLHASGVGEAWLDEQVGDLEALSNPTVGLTAHSGIVDIRIAAKTATEAEANRMIEKIEQDIRARLGNNLYGADDDTLEVAALEAAAERGWTLACIESGLVGALLTRLARSGHPAYRSGSSREASPQGSAQGVQKELAEAAESARQQFNASAALGVALSISGKEQDIFIVLITSQGKQERHLTYGGHPKNAPRWASNMALDGLRRAALERA